MMEGQGYNGVNLGDSAVLATLANIGRTGRGEYDGHGCYDGPGSREKFDGTVSVARAEENRRVNTTEHKGISDQIRDSALNTRLNNIDLKLCSVQLDIQKCCCDSQKAICEVKAEIAA